MQVREVCRDKNQWASRSGGTLPSRTMRYPPNHGVKATADGGYAANCNWSPFQTSRGNRIPAEVSRKAIACCDAFLAGPRYTSWFFPTRPIAAENGDFLVPIFLNTNHLTSICQYRLCKRMLVVKRV